MRAGLASYVYDTVSGDSTLAALVGSGPHLSMAHDGDALPYVVMRHGTTGPSFYDSGVRQLEQTPVRFFCYGSSPQTVVTLRDRCAALFERIANVSLSSSERILNVDRTNSEGPEEEEPRDTEAEVVWQAMVEMTFHVQYRRS